MVPRVTVIDRLHCIRFKLNVCSTIREPITILYSREEGVATLTGG